MEFNTRVRLAIYHHFAETGAAPTAEIVAERLKAEVDAVRHSFAELRAGRVLVLEPDGITIRMAAPFSGVPTQHTVEVGNRRYFANCAWDSLGIPAMLHTEAVIKSECAQSREPLELAIGPAGPAPTPWVFHCPVPAVRWWQDIVFT